MHLTEFINLIAVNNNFIEGYLNLIVLLIIYHIKIVWMKNDKKG
jgi:hypothetical protein